MYIYCQLVTIPCGFAVMLSCPTPNLAGVNTPYPESTIPVVALSEAKTVLSPEDLKMQCNEECACDYAVFNPICDKTKNVMYYRYVYDEIFLIHNHCLEVCQLSCYSNFT